MVVDRVWPQGCLWNLAMSAQRFKAGAHSCSLEVGGEERVATDSKASNKSLIYSDLLTSS